MLIWIWIRWVSTHLCISYHVSTCSLIQVPLWLFWCPFSALTSFLCLPVLISVSPIPPALPLYNDCPFFLISKPFTPSNQFSTFLVLIFNPDFLLLAHPLYNECLFYHVSTLFLNSNPLQWWCLFSVWLPLCCSCCLFSTLTFKSGACLVMHCKSLRICYLVDNWQQYALGLKSLGHIVFSS